MIRRLSDAPSTRCRSSVGAAGRGGAVGRGTAPRPRDGVPGPGPWPRGPRTILATSRSQERWPRRYETQVTRRPRSPSSSSPARLNTDRTGLGPASVAALFGGGQLQLT